MSSKGCFGHHLIMGLKIPKTRDGIQSLSRNRHGISAKMPRPLPPVSVRRSAFLAGDHVCRCREVGHLGEARTFAGGGGRSGRNHNSCPSLPARTQEPRQFEVLSLSSAFSRREPGGPGHGACRMKPCGNLDLCRFRILRSRTEGARNRSPRAVAKREHLGVSLCSRFATTIFIKLSFHAEPITWALAAVSSLGRSFARSRLSPSPGLPERIYISVTCARWQLVRLVSFPGRPLGRIVAKTARAGGKPLWGRSRRSSWWYPKVEVFRQSYEGDWSSVTEAVGVRLRELAKAHGAHRG